MTDVEFNDENFPSANADTDCKYSKDGWTQWFFGNSRWSMYSANALFSVLGVNTFLSLMCLNASFSFLACNTFASILSVNSAFSILSYNSFMSVGCDSGYFKICYGDDDN
ncbi:hypothetical protein FRACYDRAFT_185270 [Fragilariopsis cylindrus CCMP1102]|uniref:Uncharacterized protein n=1 Tax=Fragilariopsis cylindrus CCMP1102 TaxID=635003 RepID=A0A1E7FEX9_9STRA|nr:hypothetical protein FRACYDRAFT_185270 [Fragilariopsis cylindrus CCMP1102]|eukprot:OEU16694.1 hypothetical protein FRACYDRAFT_185270 [Fragilariopsis cylindrus CCMP1102]